MTVAKFYYQDGLPLSTIKDMARDTNTWINWYKTAEEFYFNGFSIDRIRQMYKAEDIQVDDLDEFLECLEQPKRRNGGYERSRVIIFNNLPKEIYDNIRKGGFIRSL